MKKIVLIGIAVAIAMGLTSCKKEETSGGSESGGLVKEKFSANIEREANGLSATKTMISEDNLVKWAIGDGLYYYTSDEGTERRYVVPDSGSMVVITLERGADDKYYNLVYSGRKTPVFKSRTDASMVFDGVKTEQDGTFADADVCVGRAVPGDNFVTFKRVTGLVKFQTQNSAIRFIELSGGLGTEYVAGNISVDMKAASPKGVLDGDGSTNITVSTGDLTKDGCYISVLPENYPNGLKIVLKDNTGNVIGTVVTKKVDLSAGSSRMDLGNIDEQINDLSAAGTANCYIVSAPGTYRFKAVKGNSGDAVNPTDVGVHWASFGTDETPATSDLITSVSYSDTTGIGYITFETGSKFPGRKGNAVIVAKNGSDILWSWHIWLTDAPAMQTYFDHTFLDRNLGATSATPGEKGTLGLLYQWGRKEPFLAGENAGSIEVAACAGTKWTFRNDSVSLDNAIKNPHFFYASEIDIYEPSFITDGIDWLINPNSALWGSHAAKTRYDPCPVGYRVPEKDVFASFNVDNFIWDGANYGRIYDNNVWYPAANFRRAEDGELPLVGTSGFYWSCTPVGTDGSYSSYMSFGSTSVNPSKSDWRCLGCSVRCVAE